MKAKESFETLKIRSSLSVGVLLEERGHRKGRKIPISWHRRPILPNKYEGREKQERSKAIVRSGMRVAGPRQAEVLGYYLFIYMFSDFFLRERDRGRNRDRERHRLAASHRHPYLKASMCPDQESNG